MGSRDGGQAKAAIEGGASVPSAALEVMFSDVDDSSSRVRNVCTFDNSNPIGRSSAILCCTLKSDSLVNYFDSELIRQQHMLI